MVFPCGLHIGCRLRIFKDDWHIPVEESTYWLFPRYILFNIYTSWICTHLARHFISWFQTYFNRFVFAEWYSFGRWKMATDDRLEMQTFISIDIFLPRSGYRISWAWFMYGNINSLLSTKMERMHVKRFLAHSTHLTLHFI